MLDLSAIIKAHTSLSNVLNELKNEVFIDSLSTIQHHAIKAGAIQNFEFTYELCWKFIKRWLEQNIGKAYFEGITRRELFRYAAENRLINDIEAWMSYHQARNITSHTYEEKIADEVVAIAEQFNVSAAFLIKQLQEKND